MVDGLPLMLNKNGKPCFLFYWKTDPTRFKSFEEDLLTLVERVDKVILELPALLDARVILSLPLASDPFATLDGKCLPCLAFLCLYLH